MWPRKKIKIWIGREGRVGILYTKRAFILFYFILFILFHVFIFRGSKA